MPTQQQSRLIVRRKPFETTVQRILSTQSSNLIGYWKDDENIGSTAKDSSATAADGAYGGTVTLGQPGIGDDSLSTLYGGGRISLATPISTLNSAFVTTLGTLFCCARIINPSVWIDATTRVAFEIGADANNRVFLSKLNTNNTLQISHRAGGTVKSASVTTSTTDWFSFGMTWDKANDQVIGYFNGAPMGAAVTGLGIWTGSLSSSFTAIGDFNSAGGGAPWSGYLGPVAAWKTALTAGEMARLGGLYAA